MTLHQIKVRLALRDATEALIIAYWSDQPDHHLERAQAALTTALCGGDGNKDNISPALKDGGFRRDGS